MRIAVVGLYFLPIKIISLLIIFEKVAKTGPFLELVDG